MLFPEYWDFDFTFYFILATYYLRITIFLIALNPSAFSL